MVYTVFTMKTNKSTFSSGNQRLNRAGQCLYQSARSDIYYAVFYRDNKQIKLSLKTTDKELARRRLEPIRQKIASFKSKESAALTFADLAERWLRTQEGRMKPKSFERRKVAVTAIKAQFRDTVRAIDKAKVENWAAYRANCFNQKTLRKLSAQCFNIERETLIAILDYGMRHGLILDNPARLIRRLKRNKPAVIIPTKAQFKVMLELMGTLDARATDALYLCEFLAYSGCRLNEGLSMLWKDINFDLKNFTVTGGEQGTKNHEARTVPLFPPLERHLLVMREALPAPPSSTDQLFTIGTAKRAMASACQKANLPHFTHHTLRHFFCSNAIEAGIDFKVIAGWLGHKDGGILVAKTYGHLRDEHSALMAKKMTYDASADSTEPLNVVRMVATT
jgi:integrase